MKAILILILGLCASCSSVEECKYDNQNVYIEAIMITERGNVFKYARVPRSSVHENAIKGA